MSTLNNFNPIIELTEENQEFETIPRRRIERRSATRRDCSKPKMLCPDKITTLRKLDNNAHLILRERDRRQQKRRNSRPSLLKADDIVILRKK
mgnify:CR=1 FL=1